MILLLRERWRAQAPSDETKEEIENEVERKIDISIFKTLKCEQRTTMIRFLI